MFRIALLLSLEFFYVAFGEHNLSLLLPCLTSCEPQGVDELGSPVVYTKRLQIEKNRYLAVLAVGVVLCLFKYGAKR